MGGGGAYNRNFRVCSRFHAGDAVVQNVWPLGCLITRFLKILC